MIRMMLGAVATFLMVVHASGQQRPPYPPRTPFHAAVTLPQGMTGEFHYQDGKMRVDSNGPAGMTTAYINMLAGTAILVIDMQGMKMALDVDLHEIGLPDINSVGAEHIGPDTSLIGEACERWRFIDPKTQRPGVACMTADGIPLWAGGEGEGPAMQVTALQRGPQNAADLDPPPGLPTIKASGLGDLPIPGFGR
ncbi:hypothetical protein GCM10007276_10960 [Agaricicola taiwanensis]|uniref:DUF4412 domain-containing protein n=1 Tax=Agaricicola taiwanensis TaxID=591372 RepID=A0A8J2YGH6_9RHOB|nr:hypothetical protein [Agaricicola taiwanensis]GGE35256.1 hypothetical protein GCM10007276_10960 [Agaricicola taiwanensis]